MLKRTLVVIGAMSAMLLCGCGMLGGVSKDEMESVIADRDFYMEAYQDELDNQIELQDKIADLESENAALEADILALEEELAAADTGMMEGNGEVVIHEITDDVAVKVQLPEGFSYLEDGVYIVDATDGSNITIRSALTGESGLGFTKENLEQSILSSYENMGYSVKDFEIPIFERDELNG